MNLQSVLHLNGLNRNTYNTSERRTGLGFMKRDLVEGQKLGKYTLVHTAALGCMLAFQEAGLSAQRACNATEEFFGVIAAFVWSVPEGGFPAEQSWLNVIAYADGSWGWASGAQGRDSFGPGVAISRVAINLQAVWSRLAARLSVPPIEELREPELEVSSSIA